MKPKFVWLSAALLAMLAVPNCAAIAETNPVIATVGGHQITEKEVDAKLKSELANMQSKLYEMRKGAIDQIADDYLIEQAAKKENLSAADYQKREILDKVATPSDTEAHNFYNQHKAQIPQPYEKVKNQIIAGLKQQRAGQRRQEMVAQLRKSEPVKIKLEPPRFEVATTGAPAEGSADAPVTIVEFADFQCPFCKRSEETVKQIRTTYGDKVRLVHRDFPLSFHQHAMDAAEAARCANEQDKFWPYRDAIFADQSKLAPADLKALAAKLTLDPNKFAACFDSAKYASAIGKDQAAGDALGVDGTPAFFINGRMISGAQPLPAFEDVINDELARKGVAKTSDARGASKSTAMQ